MTKRATLFLAAALLVLPLAAGADVQPVATQSYVPRLSDIMGLTQLRHFKLWYAGSQRNWPLAQYELGQIKESFRDAMTYYPGIPASNMTTMEKPSDAIATAIRTKNEAQFRTAFGQLTAACNSCHQAQGYGYIVIKLPTASPFSNEVFAPRP